MIFGLLNDFTLQNKLEYQQLLKKYWLWDLQAEETHDIFHVASISRSQLEHLSRKFLIKRGFGQMTPVWWPYNTSQGAKVCRCWALRSSAVQAGSGQPSHNCKVGQIPSNQKFQLQIQCWLKRFEFTGVLEINASSYFSQSQSNTRLSGREHYQDHFCCDGGVLRKKPDQLFPELPIPHRLKPLGDIFNQYF